MQASVFRVLWVILLASAFQCSLLISSHGSETNIHIANASKQEYPGYILSAGKTHTISKFYLNSGAANIFVSSEIQKAPFYQGFILIDSAIELSRGLLQQQLVRTYLYYADFFQRILFPFHGFW